MLSLTRQEVSLWSLNKIKAWKNAHAFVQKGDFAKCQVGLDPGNSTKYPQFQFENQVSETNEGVVH